MTLSKNISPKYLSRTVSVVLLLTGLLIAALGGYAAHYFITKFGE